MAEQLQQRCAEIGSGRVCRRGLVINIARRLSGTSARVWSVSHDAATRRFVITEAPAKRRKVFSAERQESTAAALNAELPGAGSTVAWRPLDRRRARAAGAVCKHVASFPSTICRRRPPAAADAACCSRYR